MSTMRVAGLSVGIRSTPERRTARRTRMRIGPCVVVAEVARRSRVAQQAIDPRADTNLFGARVARCILSLLIRCVRSCHDLEYEVSEKPLAVSRIFLYLICV